MNANCCACDVLIDPDDACPYCPMCEVLVMAYLAELDEYYQGDHESHWTEVA